MLLAFAFLRKIKHRNRRSTHLRFGCSTGGAETLRFKNLVVDIAVALQHLFHYINIRGNIEHVFLVERVDLLLTGSEHHVHAADSGITRLGHILIGNAPLLHETVIRQDFQRRRQVVVHEFADVRRFGRFIRNGTEDLITFVGQGVHLGRQGFVRDDDILIPDGVEHFLAFEDYVVRLLIAGQRDLGRLLATAAFLLLPAEKFFLRFALTVTPVMCCGIQFFAYDAGNCADSGADHYSQQKTGKTPQREKNDSRCNQKTGTAGLAVIIRVIPTHSKNLLEVQNQFIIPYKKWKKKIENLLMQKNRADYSGKIRKKEPHEELFAKNGVYRRLCDMQHQS